MIEQPVRPVGCQIPWISLDCYFRHGNWAGCTGRVGVFGGLGMRSGSNWMQCTLGLERRGARRASDCSIYRALHNLWHPVCPRLANSFFFSSSFSCCWSFEFVCCLWHQLKGLRVCHFRGMLPRPQKLGPPNSYRTNPSPLVSASVFELCSFSVPGSFTVFGGFPELLGMAHLPYPIALAVFQMSVPCACEISPWSPRRGVPNTQTSKHTHSRTFRAADSAITCANEVWCWPKCDSLCRFFVTISISGCVVNSNCSVDNCYLQIIFNIYTINIQLFFILFQSFILQSNLLKIFLLNEFILNYNWITMIWLWYTVCDRHYLLHFSFGQMSLCKK